MKEQLIDELNEKLTGKDPEEILSFFLDRYRGKIVFASSM